MIASAHRRTDKQAEAFSLYKKLHCQFPTNIECLESLVMLCKTMHEPYHQYQQKLESVSLS
jgi:intraflagellar transport protein 88